MKRRHEDRLRKLTKMLDDQPVPVDDEKPAFEHFRDTGELPESQWLARAIVRRCKDGRGNRWGPLDRAARIRLAVANAPAHDDVLHRLYDEAVWGEEHVRLAARAVLRALKRSGFDVTRRVFDDVGLDDVMQVDGGVGLWLMGFPERLESRHALIGE